MTMKITNTPSIIQSFFKLEINFRKIRSEIKNTTADKKPSPASVYVTSICPGR